MERGGTAAEEKVVREVPSALKQLARLIVRGFYMVEDVFIIDMLVRNPCMREDDLCDLLKFERKMLRSRIDTLRNDRLIQTRMKMETGVDGKAQRHNFYYINYKILVNVVKYKLDHMRRKIEVEERNATNRANFVCPKCDSCYTDLQADQLFDASSGEFVCTYCGSVLSENCSVSDTQQLQPQDTRVLLARFNEVMEPVFFILREVEGIKLAPEILEPEPLNTEDLGARGAGLVAGRRHDDANFSWSGEATRVHNQDTSVNVTLDTQQQMTADSTQVADTRPIWMLQSTVVTEDAEEEVVSGTTHTSAAVPPGGATDRVYQSATRGAGGGATDIMSVLLQHETLGGRVHGGEGGDSPVNGHAHLSWTAGQEGGDCAPGNGEMVSVLVAGTRVSLDSVDADIIARMTPAEKHAYVLAYQEHYSHLYE